VAQPIPEKSIMDTGGPVDGLTANQCHGYASRSDGSLGQRRVNDRFLGAGFVPQKTNSRDFCAGLPPAASGHANAPPSTPRNARRFMSNPRLRRRHRVVMTKTSTLEGGWNGPRVQVIAPHVGLMMSEFCPLSP